MRYYLLNVLIYGLNLRILQNYKNMLIITVRFTKQVQEKVYYLQLVILQILLCLLGFHHNINNNIGLNVE